MPDYRTRRAIDDPWHRAYRRDPMQFLKDVTSIGRSIGAFMTPRETEGIRLGRVREQQSRQAAALQERKFEYQK